MTTFDIGRLGWIDPDLRRVIRKYDPDVFVVLDTKVDY